MIIKTKHFKLDEPITLTSEFTINIINGHLVIDNGEIAVKFKQIKGKPDENQS